MLEVTQQRGRLESEPGVRQFGPVKLLMTIYNVAPHGVTNNNNNKTTTKRGTGVR